MDSSPSLRPPPTLLVAEDNEATTTALTDYLETMGYRVTLARNGAEVVALARAVRPDLILMDIQMPGVDGLEATRRVRADPDLAAVPIIAVTALALPGDRERCLQAGASDYLSKPFSLKALVKAIEAHLARVD